MNECFSWTLKMYFACSFHLEGIPKSSLDLRGFGLKVKYQISHNRFEIIIIIWNIDNNKVTRSVLSHIKPYCVIVSMHYMLVLSIRLYTATVAIWAKYFHQ